jgi:hypothetical protein
LRLDPALAFSAAKPFLGRVSHGRADDSEARKSTAPGVAEDGSEFSLGHLLREVAIGRRTADDPGGPETLLDLPPADPVLAYHWACASA